MDTARQLVRWSIPGAVFLLYVSLFTSALREWAGISATIDGVSPAALVFASVPVGFVLYQVYFLGYERGRKYLPPVDRGQHVLHRVAQELGDDIDFGTALAELTGWSTKNLAPDQHTEVWRRLGSRPIYRLKLSTNMQAYRRARTDNLAVASVLTDYIDAGNGSPYLRREYTSLADIYHSQGACRTALWTGFLATAANVAPWPFGDWSWFSILAVAFIALLTAALYLVFDFARRNTLLRLESTWAYGLVAGCRNPKFAWPGSSHGTQGTVED